MGTRRLTPGGRQLRGWGLTMWAARRIQAAIRREGGPQSTAVKSPTTRPRRWGFSSPGGGSVPLRTDNMAGVYRHLSHTCQGQKSRQDATGRPKNVRNGVVMWKKRPAVPLTAFLVCGLSLPDAASLQVFHLVVTRLRSRRCGRCRGHWAVAAPRRHWVCGCCRSQWASG